MARPVTLFTGQWADLQLEELCRKAQEFGYDGLELASWRDLTKAPKVHSTNAEPIQQYTPFFKLDRPEMLSLKLPWEIQEAYFLDEAFYWVHGRFPIRQVVKPIYLASEWTRDDREPLGFETALANLATENDDEALITSLIAQALSVLISDLLDEVHIARGCIIQWANKPYVVHQNKRCHWWMVHLVRDAEEEDADGVIEQPRVNLAAHRSVLRTHPYSSERHRQCLQSFLVLPMMGMTSFTHCKSCAI